MSWASAAHQGALAEARQGEMEVDDEDIDEGIEVGDIDFCPSYAQRVSMAEYDRQTMELTKAEVDALIQSPEYQRKHTRCQMCWSVWSEGQFSEHCLECGGFAMERNCPICSGKCGCRWTRDVDMSHNHNEAHWDGECLLPWEERQGFLQNALCEENTQDEDAVIGALTDLSTS